MTTDKDALAIKLHTLAYSIVPSGTGADGKKAMIKWKEYQTRAATYEEVEKWIKAGNVRTWAMITGKISNVFAVDTDNSEGELLMKRAGLSPHVITAKGAHYYFRRPNFNIKTVSRLLDGIDIRGEGGYVNFAGACGNNGATYNMVTIPTPDTLYSFDQLPPHIQQALRAKLPIGERLFQKYLAEVHEGQRNDKGFGLAQQLHDNRVDKAEAEAIILRYQQAVEGFGNEPYTQEEALASLESAYSYAPREPWGTGPTTAPAGNDLYPFPKTLTEATIAEAVAHYHKGVARYLHEWKAWIVYKDGHWREDTAKAVKRLTIDTTRRLLARAAVEIDDTEALKAATKYLLGCENDKRITAILNLALTQDNMTVSANQLDANPWLLNVKNGTIDLKTCTLRPHSPQDFLTKMIPVDYTYGASSAEWDEFIDTIFNKLVELVDYTQRGVGFSLNGTQLERIFFFLHGLGFNGKSQFVGAIRRVLGPYAYEIKPEVFMEYRGKEGSGPNEGVAALRGVRFLTATEVKRGQNLDISLVKRMTGGEPLWHERKYQSGYSFDPTHTLWLSGNHEPKIKDTTDSIWDRLNKLPFTIRIPADKEIKGYGEKLAREHGQAILAWCIEGARKWNERGLTNPPECVRAANADYRARQDKLHDFEKAHILREIGQTVLVGDMYKAYCLHCIQNEIEPEKKIAFNELMREKGYIDKRGTGNALEWIGVTLVISVIENGETFLYRAHIDKVSGIPITELTKVTKVTEVTEVTTPELPLEDCGQATPQPLPDCPNCGDNNWKYEGRDRVCGSCDYREKGAI